jgi:hypothetical protein
MLLFLAGTGTLGFVVGSYDRARAGLVLDTGWSFGQVLQVALLSCPLIMMTQAFFHEYREDNDKNLKYESGKTDPTGHESGYLPNDQYRMHEIDDWFDGQILGYRLWKFPSFLILFSVVAIVLLTLGMWLRLTDVGNLTIRLASIIACSIPICYSATLFGVVIEGYRRDRLATWIFTILLVFPLVILAVPGMIFSFFFVEFGATHLLLLLIIPLPLYIIIGIFITIGVSKLKTTRPA